MHPNLPIKRLLDMGYLSRICIIGNNPRAAHIASWLANSGCQVDLLGVVAKDTFDLEPIARSGLYVPEFSSRIKVGLVRDNIDALRRATWIHDCNSSNADIKDSVYSVIDTIIAPDAAATTDDTILPISNYTDKRSSIFSRRFFVLQFAEPMVRPELGEYALTTSTEPERAEALVRELSSVTGVRLVNTPLATGLVSYRLSLLYCMLAVSIAERLQLGVVQADRYAEALGLVQPFRTIDQSVFNDTMTYGIALCQEYGLSGLPRSMKTLYDSPKHSHGFYSSETGQAVVLDLQTLAYRGASDEPDSLLDEICRLPQKDRMAAALAASGPFGEYARETNKAIGTLTSLLRQRQTINDNHLQLALRYAIGLKSDQPDPMPATDSVVYVPWPTINLEQARQLTEAVVAKGSTPFVVSGSDEGFCTGINLEELLNIVASDGKDGLLEYCLEFQRLIRAFASANCVAAIHGQCTGFGLELALACNKIVADAGTKIGIDQARYGLMPMAGGSVKMRLMGQKQGAKRLADIAAMLATGKVAQNAFEARKNGLIPVSSEVVVNRRSMLAAANAWLSSLPEKDHLEWQAVAGPLTGLIDQQKLTAKQKGELGQHGELLMDKAKALMTKPASAAAAQDLETETFVELAGKALSQARMRYTISTGKVLHN